MAEKSYNHDIQLEGVSKVKGSQQAQSSGELVEYSQWQSENALKQDIVLGGSGIAKDGVTLSVDLATSGTDYGTLQVSGANYSALNGTYQRASYQAYLEYAGTNLDLFYGGDWSFYYKDNGSGVWSIVSKRDTDGDDGTSPESGTWLACLVTVDPETIVSNYSSFIPNYQAVNYDFLTSSSEQNELGFSSPSSTDSNVDYALGNDPSGLIFSNGKLALDLAQSVGANSSTKVFPSSIVKTYIDEQITEAKDLSNHPFNNAVAQISGNPSNAQSMGEALAGEVDNLDGQVLALQLQDVTHSQHIADHLAMFGVSQGDDVLPDPTGAAAVFAGTSGNVVGHVQSLGDAIQSVYQNMGAINGLAAFETDFGDGFTILPNDSALKPILQAVELELQQLASGAGATWDAGVVQVAVTTNQIIAAPLTDVFEGETISQGEIILLTAQTDASENGFYVFDTDSTAMVRWVDADASADFIQNRSVQIVSTGNEWAYTGSGDPVLETDDLEFHKIRESIIADLSVSEAKLDSALSSKINAKSDIFGDASVVLDGVSETVVTHGLGTEFPIVQVYGDTGYLENYTVRYIDVNSIGVNSNSAETVKVVVQG